NVAFVNNFGTGSYYGLRLTSTTTNCRIAGNDFSGCNATGAFSLDVGTGHRLGEGNIPEPYPPVTAATTTTLPACRRANITGNANITSITADYSGRQVVLRFAGTPTVTDGSNLKL